MTAIANTLEKLKERQPAAQFLSSMQHKVFKLWKMFGIIGDFLPTSWASKVNITLILAKEK